MITDPIADYLTRVRNAVMARHRVVEVPASNMKKDITKILFDKGYILNYKFEDDGKQGIIKIALKYHPETKACAIKQYAGGKYAASGCRPTLIRSWQRWYPGQKSSKQSIRSECKPDRIAPI